MRVTYTFDKVTLAAVKNLPCPVCGKKTRRQATFWQTLNPYNTVDGRPKTEKEIRAELHVEAEAWRAVPEPHMKCHTI